MNKTDELVPKLRFKQFANENSVAWKPDFLKNISKITMGQSPSSKNYTDNPQDSILVQGNADLYEGRVVPRVYTTQITNKAEKGSIILSVRAPVGDVGITDFDVVIGRGVAALNGSYFLYQILKRLKSTGYWRKYITGSTFESINSSDIKNAKVNIPSLPEQTAIGNFFKKIDERITANEHKLEHLKQQKKGLLQKMFPKKGDTVPEMRFKGFEGEWKEVRLENIANRYDNLRKPVTASKREKGLIPYYGANGIQDYVNGFTHNGSFVLVAEDGASDLKNYPVLYVDGKFWANNHAHVLQSKINKSDNLFLKNVIKRTNMEKYLVGGGRAKLNADVLMKILISTPSLQEQSHIGNFFQKYDQLITAQQNKINHLKQQKQALLQQMFV